MPVAVEKKVMFAPECTELPPEPSSSVLFQTVVPRRRRDKFGRDTTRRSDFLLSATVFPTGVRAPALEELQQKCGPTPRSDTSRDLPPALPGQSWPGTGPKVLSLRKGKTPSKESPRSQYLRSSAESHLRPYSWASKRRLKDVRDPMYINTYFPDERPLRYKDSTLPKIGKNRPWSVGESNPSKRFVKINNESRKSAGKISNETRIQGTPLQRSREPFYTAANRQDSEQYFEVKRMSADHRYRPRGQDACLYSQVRQSIRLTTKLESQRGRQPERPLKSEIGRYRPFSTTKIRTPCPSPTLPPGFIYKEPDSAETYRQYMLTKVLQTRVSVKSAGTIISGLAARNNTAASNYNDSESQILQSVADSNLPDVDSKSSSEASQNSETRQLVDPQTLGLDIRGASIVLPKSARTGKLKLSDCEGCEKVQISKSPKKEVVLSRRRDRTKGLERPGSEMSAQLDIRVTCTPEPSPEPTPEPIKLDESGNPVIWRNNLTSTPDSAIIKIPAVDLSMLSIEDTEEIGEG